MSHSDELSLSPTHEELNMTRTEKTVVRQDSMEVEGDGQDQERSDEPTGGNIDSVTDVPQPSEPKDKGTDGTSSRSKGSDSKGKKIQKTSSSKGTSSRTVFKKPLPKTSQDLRPHVERRKTEARLGRQSKSRGTVTGGNPGYRVILPAQKARHVINRWSLSYSYPQKHGSSTISVTLNSSPNAVVTISNHDKEDAILTLLEMTNLAFDRVEKKQVRLLLYTEEIGRIHGASGRFLENLRKGRNCDIYPHISYAPASDERVLKITGSMGYVDAATRRVLDLIDFRGSNSRLRHYTPSRLYDQEYRTRWGGYNEPVGNSQMDTSVFPNPHRQVRSSTPFTTRRQAPFQPPPSLRPSSSVPVRQPSSTQTQSHSPTRHLPSPPQAGTSQETPLTASAVNAMIGQHTAGIMEQMASLLQNKLEEVYTRMEERRTGPDTETLPSHGGRRPEYVRAFEKLGRPMNTSSYDKDGKQTKTVTRHADLASLEDRYLSEDDNDDDDVDDITSMDEEEQTPEGSDTSFPDPGPAVRSDVRVFVIGESHLKTSHYCTLKALLAETGAEVPMYEPIGGATFRKSEVSTAMNNAVQEVRQGDVVLLMIGSNDARNIAREDEPDTLPNIKSVLEVMAVQASEKKFHLLVVPPLPSPCYEKRWCQRTVDEVCEHEIRYQTAQASITDVMNSAIATSPESSYVVPRRFFKKLLTKRKRFINRGWFHKNDIHLNCHGAEILCSALLSVVRQYLF